ncbi:UNVERIFIED_CONTAM: hypothetical protein GTU68_065132 [Idotea baltica]|nr:hypothetical protein [Idotea baltica]
MESSFFLIHFICSNLNIELQEKQMLLNNDNEHDRAEKVLKHLNKEIQLLELKNKIQNKVKVDIEKQQRDYFLSQQLKTIHEELGTQDGVGQEIEALILKSKDKNWPEDVAKSFNKEINKIQRMNPAVAEYSVSLNYLELLLDLPWQDYTEDNFDLEHAKSILDTDHYGLEKVKDRILEYLAVLKLKGDMKSPILCLTGPPGVGKTSLGKSIAKALNRKYVRMSLGGLHDESEVRGHRKTYIGAMPGRIIQSLKKAKTSNPVFILDEIDKVGSDFRGDPSSALLEVLDPEQNENFYDNYLEMEYDLSRVLFIATANSLATIQPALLDRMEIIHISGYSIEEKVEIAKKHLIPKQRANHGLKAKHIKISKPSLERIVDDYTRESGVRNLERMIASVMRNIAKSVAMEEEYDSKINPDREGAIPKDGPSAGITMLTAFASVLSDRKVRPYIAMTGEITLRGKVLPVGGIKEKMLAAKRAGVKEIILCKSNEKDVKEINPSYIKQLKFHYVHRMEDVLKLALTK